MSAPAAAALKCSICEHPLKGTEDTQKIRDRSSGKSTRVRCFDYAGCMVRSARQRRREIGAPEEEGTHGR